MTVRIKLKPYYSKPYYLRDDCTLNQFLVIPAVKWDLDVHVGSDLDLEITILLSGTAPFLLILIIQETLVRTWSAEFILKLYLALVKPHFLHDVQHWCPYYRKDVDSLKSVEKSDQNDLRTQKYAEPIKLNLHSLERLRL